MGAVAEAYCNTEDLRVGDVTLAHGVTKEQYVKGAAEEIDIALGHKYVTPIVIPVTSENRPSILFLKKINWLLASARLLLDISSPDDDAPPTYAMSMLREATTMLKSLTNDDITLVGAPVLDVEKDEAYRGPVIINADPVSLVETFYTERQGHHLFPPRPVVPYGIQ